MKQLLGAEVSAVLKEQIKSQLLQLNGYIPKLAIIRVGENPDDIAYERGAKKKLEAFGLACETYAYTESISDADFRQQFIMVNSDPKIDGILLLRPLPNHLDEKEIELLMDPEKDMDGISPMNMAKIFNGDNTAIAPCTASAVIELLDKNHIEVEGKQVVIIGRSMVVGKPLSMLLLNKNATITICHSKTEQLKEICKGAQIIISAVGQPRKIDVSYIGKDAIVIDVGINMDENNKLCGDVDFLSIEPVASMATPVPGGVGPVTTAVLAKHLVQAALNSKNTLNQSE